MSCRVRRRDLKVGSYASSIDSNCVTVNGWRNSEMTKQRVVVLDTNDIHYMAVTADVVLKEFKERFPEEKE